MVTRLQNVLALMRRDVVANPDRSRDHCLTNDEIERTARMLWKGCLYMVCVTHKNEHDRIRTISNASYSERSI